MNDYVTVFVSHDNCIYYSKFRVLVIGLCGIMIKIVMMVIIVAMSTVCNNFIQFSEQVALGKFISPSYFSLLTTQECDLASFRFYILF